MNTYRMKTIALASVSLVPLAAAGQGGAKKPAAAERPNILWLTFEDISSYAFGCYGNRHVTTPVIDSLARNGLQFMNAYSNGPQSSPARSCIITGCYSTTYAMDWHRRQVPTPEDILFPKYMHDAGYFCTNMSKTDYNTTLDNKAVWDHCGGNGATYNNPERGDRPFFAVFNSGITHMSRITSVHLDGRRDFSKEGLDPASLDLPPHVPDIEAIRSDYAFHLEGANDIDRWIKLFLDDLKKHGLEENTIIFLYSDHGGCLPRGKAFGYESSYRVPMVVYLPPKWRHLSKMPVGKPVGRLVAFADLAPTVLSIAGAEPLKFMQGLPFLGRYDKAERKYQFGLVCNRETHYVPARSVSDGRWKYARNYIPYKRDALFNSFQWQMPGNLWWDKSYFENTNMTDIWRKPYEVCDAEALYDLESDPFELVNIADKYPAKLAEMRKVLGRHIRETVDLGFFPLSVRLEERPLYDRVREKGYDIEQLYSLAELTATVDTKDIPKLIASLKGAGTEIRYWVAVNFGVLAAAGKLTDPPAELTALVEDADPQVSSEAVFALSQTSKSAQAFEYMRQKRDVCALEVLSLHKGMRAKIPAGVIDMLKELSAAYERKDKSHDKDEMIGARKVLVNLGMLPAEQLYGERAYEAGLKVNEDRRKLTPVPYYKQ